MRPCPSPRGPIPAILIAAVALTSLHCASTIRRVENPALVSSVSQLWREPANIRERNLFYGTGGQAALPPEGPYKLIKEDRTGASPGYDVRDSRGRNWSVKMGEEAQVEVVMSRVLWALGYYQDPLYYVSNWRFEAGTDAVTPPARFRLERESRDVAGDWSWRQNPFIGTRAFSGLIVTNVLMNNWDWKTNNNKIYAVREEGGTLRREYVVRDLGAALGGTRTYPVWLQWSRARGVLQGTKNNLEDFERQGFVKGVRGERVRFDYRGIHGDLLESITPADVVWTCQLLGRLSDAQWDDAFRAADFAQPIRARYIAQIKKKIQEGLALADSTAASRSASVRR